MDRRLWFLLVPLYAGLIFVGGLSGFWALSRPPREETGYYEYMGLWLGEPNVKDAPYEPSWVQGDETGAEHQECISVTEYMKSLIANGSSPVLESILLFPVADVRRNSVYLLVDASSEVKREILALIDVPHDVSVCFIDAPASREMLYMWLNHAFTLSEIVEVRGMGLTLNGTILVELEEVTFRSVRAVLRAFDGYVPPGILVIRKFV
ncbi:MAG: hypothetical protein JSV18_07490 [Candidatus Bathyarchaeota archaeon]|nr:MAG: hypothetical protein JSV18_07490 [Candidatus Bathyarchaeota archaeon]